MYEPLDDAKLKTGEILEIGVVDAPDDEWRERLVAFLGHKGDQWLPQIELALTRPLDCLRTFYYIGEIEGQLACQAVVSGNRSSAILGHVYSAPEHRQKGAIRALLEALMTDLRTRFRWMSLGSEYGSPAHNLYKSLGFKSVAPGSGEMAWSADGSWSFPPAPETSPSLIVRATRWEDWSTWSLLALQPVSDEENLPRSPQLGLYGQGGLEYEFLQLQMQRNRNEKIQAVSLVAENDMICGWAILSPTDSLLWDLDLYAHPSAHDQLPQLLESLNLSCPVACLVKSYDLSDAKVSALEAAGFASNTARESWTDSHGQTHSVIRMVRAD